MVTWRLEQSQLSLIPCPDCGLRSYYTKPNDFIFTNRTCPICLQQVRDPVVFKCNNLHVFCNNCARQIPINTNVGESPFLYNNRWAIWNKDQVIFEYKNIELIDTKWTLYYLNKNFSID